MLIADFVESCVCVSFGLGSVCVRLAEVISRTGSAALCHRKRCKDPYTSEVSSEMLYYDSGCDTDDTDELLAQKSSLHPTIYTVSDTALRARPSSTTMQSNKTQPSLIVNDDWLFSLDSSRAGIFLVVHVLACYSVDPLASSDNALDAAVPLALQK